MKKNIIILVLLVTFGYTGFQTYKTQLASFQLKEYLESPRRQLDTLLAWDIHNDTCKIRYNSPSPEACFKYKNFIDNIGVKYLKTRYGNEILCALSFLLIIALIIKIKRKNTVPLQKSTK